MLNILSILSIVAVLLTAGPATPIPAQAAAACQVDYQVVEDWGSGFTAEIIVTNNNQEAVKDWTLTWTFPGDQRINNLWEGTLSRDGRSVSVSNADWNTQMEAGGTASFGFLASYSGVNQIPTGFTLNGQPCSDSTSPPETPFSDPAPAPPPRPKPKPATTEPTRRRQLTRPLYRTLHRWQQLGRPST